MHYPCYKRTYGLGEECAFGAFFFCVCGSKKEMDAHAAVVIYFIFILVYIIKWQRLAKMTLT